MLSDGCFRTYTKSWQVFARWKINRPARVNYLINNKRIFNGKACRKKHIEGGQKSQVSKYFIVSPQARMREAFSH